jgi:hypothetical protein
MMATFAPCLGVGIDGEWFDAELGEPVGECPGRVE